MSSDTTREKNGKWFEVFTNANKKSQARLFAEINKDVEAFLSKANNDTDWTGEIFDFFSQISDSVQEQFDKHWSSDNNKKRFIRTLSKILALLLILRVYTAEKIKRIIKIAIETMLKMARTKATVRCFLASARCVVCCSAKNNITIKNKRNITTTKNNRYKKNRQIIKIINVRRKSIWRQK